MNNKAYISRYIVPFFFDYSNEKYSNLLDSLRKGLLTENKQYSTVTVINKNGEEKTKAVIAGVEMNQDTAWREMGFWENDDRCSPEMDTYSYLIDIFGETKNTVDNSGSNLGVCFSLKSSGKLLELFYKVSNEETIPFYCSELGVIIFKNGTGFAFYEIMFKKIPDLSVYVEFQHRFKELARLKKDDILIKKKNEFKPFCMGIWLSELLNVKQLGIHFFAEKNIDPKEHNGIENIPDKTLLYQYLFVDESRDSESEKLVYRTANGYNESYVIPENIGELIYRPFGNLYIHISKLGMSTVAENNNTNDRFFCDNFKSKYTTDYFMLYILLLYQSYSCRLFAKLLTNLPAEIITYSDDMKYSRRLESLNQQISLFLVKGVYGSVSNIHHQNATYEYGKKALSIENDIAGLTIGLDALSNIENEKLKKEEDKRDRRLSNCLIVFGFLVVSSAAMDAVSFIDWLVNPETKMNLGHFAMLGFVGVITVIMIIAFILNLRKKK